MLETFRGRIRNKKKTKDAKEGIENERNIKMQDTRNGQGEVKSARLCIPSLLQFLIRFRSRANCTFVSFMLHN
jgi:hypothetical protein